jgi:radical SAM superfamily enzyme YgiQ (UPF0313 family)
MSENARRAPFRRILLVNPPMAHIGAEFMMEDVPLRLEYLASYIRTQVEAVEVLDLANSPGDLAKSMKKFRPDLVGISINYISTHANALKMAAIAKAAGYPVVLGGYHATAMVETFLKDPSVDFVVRGEGEETLRELVSDAPFDQIRGLSYWKDNAAFHNDDRPLIADLDTIPFPDRSRRDRKYKLPFADLDSNVSTAYEMIITSRGCWGRCTFCTEGLMTDGTQRYRKPEKVIQELDEIVRLHKGKRLRIHIADPNFGGKRRITEELYERMAAWRKTCGADVRFFVSLRPSAISESRELTKKMFQAGIDYLFVGMESPNNEELKRVLKGGETRERQETAAKYLREEGAEIMSNFLIGLPGQTADDVLGLVDYAKKLELADCYFSVVTPLPGSVLYTEAVEKNLLLETDVTKYRLYDTVMKHDKMSRQKVREMCVRANARWYDDLMLPAERRRSMANGKKRKLYDFAGKFTVLVNFFSFIGSGVSKEFADLDPALMVKDMPNPKLRQFTTENPLHSFIDMERFLKILGPQRIQVTMQSKGVDVVSWEAVTGKNTFEYIDAIHGRPTTKPTIAINVAMDPGALTGRKFLARILADNSSLASRVALARVAAAGGSEVAVAWFDKTREKVKEGVSDWMQNTKETLAKWGRKLTGQPEPTFVSAGPAAPPAAKPSPPTARRVPSTVPASSLIRKAAATAVEAAPAKVAVH